MLEIGEWKNNWKENPKKECIYVFCSPSAGDVDMLWLVVFTVGEGKEVATVKVASAGNFNVLTLFFARFSNSAMWR